MSTFHFFFFKFSNWFLSARISRTFSHLQKGEEDKVDSVILASSFSNKHNPKSAQHLRKRTPQILIIKIENFSKKYRKQLTDEQRKPLKVAGECAQQRTEQGDPLLCLCLLPDLWTEPNRTERIAGACCGCCRHNNSGRALPRTILSLSRSPANSRLSLRPVSIIVC